MTCLYSIPNQSTNVFLTNPKPGSWRLKRMERLPWLLVSRAITHSGPMAVWEWRAAFRPTQSRQCWWAAGFQKYSGRWAAKGSLPTVGCANLTCWKIYTILFIHTWKCISVVIREYLSSGLICKCTCFPWKEFRWQHWVEKKRSVEYRKDFLSFIMLQITLHKNFDKLIHKNYCIAWKKNKSTIVP